MDAVSPWRSLFLLFAAAAFTLAVQACAEGARSLSGSRTAFSPSESLPSTHPSQPAMSEQPDSQDTETPPRLTLLDDRWHQWGPITGEYIYTGEGFQNCRGGISTRGATRYRGNLDAILTLDTGKANWWEGGELFVYMQHSHGQTLSADFVGDGQLYSSIDTSPHPQDLTRLGEYWYRHTFDEETLAVKAGRLDASADFAFADLGGDFLNASFIVLPNVPLPYWGFQTLGVSSVYQVDERLSLAGGAYDHGQDRGHWWVTTASRGMFFIGQMEYRPWAECEDAPLTILRLGTWFTNSDAVAHDESHIHEANYGFYGTIDRMLFAERDDAEQGLGAFCQCSWAPADRNQIDQHYGAGLVYRGLIPLRDADTMGIGFTLVRFSADLGELTGQTSENAIELFYKARLREWLAVQPDMQYIARPSGLERDALVVGLRFEASF